MHRTALRFAPLLLAAPAFAQTPWWSRPEVFVNDSSNDRVTRLRDLDGDGLYLGALESTVFYDDTIGGFPLSNNIGVVQARDGVVYVCDSSSDLVLGLKDTDADGTAHTPGEAWIFYDPASSVTLVPMPSSANMHWHNGVLWVAVAQSGSTGRDTILRLEDLNNDGDAQDASEAREYYVIHDPSLGGGTGASIPQDVHVGLDGKVYYLETGSTGLFAKGVYQLDDLNLNGTIEAPGEVKAWFLPPALPATAFYWGFDQDATGAWFMADSGNERIWRFRDDDNNGAIDPGESSSWWIAPGTSLIWNVRCGADGAVYVGESQDNERLYRMFDANGDGSIQHATEVEILFDELTAAGLPIGQQRGFNLEARWLAPSEAYCSAQANSLGCTSVISSLGTPSATHGSGFFVRAAPIRNQKAGLLFYSTFGRASTPFSGGTMCVQGPPRRTPVLASGGSPTGDDCTGSFSFDFNTYAASGIDPALVSGVTVNTQFWSRDSGAPANTNLSGGLEFALRN